MKDISTLSQSATRTISQPDIAAAMQRWHQQIHFIVPLCCARHRHGLYCKDSRRRQVEVPIFVVIREKHGKNQRLLRLCNHLTYQHENCCTWQFCCELRCRCFLRLAVQPDRVDPRKDQKLGKAKFNEKSFGRCNLKTFLQRVVATPYTLQVYNYRRAGEGMGG